MNTLIIDSSNKYLAVGIVVDGQIVSKKQDILKQKQSEYLITYVQDVLKEAELDRLDIDAIVLTDGPGSYTGMRIAMTFAKVFALTKPIQLYTLNTLLSLTQEKNGFVFLDARSKRTFGAFLENGKLRDEKVYTLDEIKEFNIPLCGDVELLGKDAQEVDVVGNILAQKDAWQEVKDPNLLSPRYA